MIDSHSYRPAYQQVADLLRDQITNGELQPGDQLPGSPQLMTIYGISSTTARDALDQLRNEGLVVAISGRGTFVRQPASVRRLSSERYTDQLRAIAAGKVPQESAFTRDHGITWSQYSVDCDFAETDTDLRVGGLLEVDPGARVFARRMVMRAAGQAEQIRTSYHPLDLVRGTPMTDQDRQPWPGGVIAELAALGVIPTRVDEEIATRMPTPEESHTLRMLEGTPVLVITRVGRTADRVIEVADMVLPGDRTRLHYRLEL